MNIKLINVKRKFLILLLIGISVSCSNLKGDLIVKGPEEDHFVHLNKRAEFSKNSNYEWIYKIRKIAIKEFVTVTYLKKELVWVNVKTSNYNLTRIQCNIYGNFNDLSEGTYRLVFWNIKQKKIMDDIKFTIYNDE